MQLVTFREELGGFLSKIEGLVEFFSLDAQQTIKTSMVEDWERAQKLWDVHKLFCKHGDFVAANRIMSLSRQICEHSWSTVIPMRQNIKSIADALLELQELDVRRDSAAVRDIIAEIKEATDEAVKIAVLGQTKLRKLRDELSRLKAEHAEQEKEFAEKRQKEREAWVGSSELPTAGAFTFSLGSAGATFFLPGCFDPLLFVCCVGGLTLTAAFWHLRSVTRPDQEQMVKAATEEAESSRTIVKKSEEAVEAAKKMEEQAISHEDIWKSIGESAQKIVDAPFCLESAQALGEGDLRSLRCCGEQLLQFVRAIDHYLVSLSTTGCFPPNFDIQAAVGIEAYDGLERDAGRRTMAALPRVRV